MRKRAKSLWLMLAATLLLAFLFPASAFAATPALRHDRNGTPYTYVIGYMYSGYRGSVNTREIFVSPNNYDIWLCPTCGKGGGSNGTDLAENVYMPCYGYDIPATGGDMGIRYALVRHRHNNGTLSENMVYIPINVAMYSACHYGYDTAPPTGPRSSAPAGWQCGAVTVNFWGGADAGSSLPGWATVPGNYGSGLHHYEYHLDGGAWTGCPVGTPSVTIVKGGATTVTSWLADGAGNDSDEVAVSTVYIDDVAPNTPSVTPATSGWTNQDVLVTATSNGDTYSGVNRLETSLSGNAFVTYNGPVRVSAHGKQTITARAVDNVGWVSGNAAATVYIDKIAPVIGSVSQAPNAGRTSVTLNISASDADSGVAGYAATRTASPPALGAFSAAMPAATENGSWTVWARDVAGNISVAKTVAVTAIDREAPSVAAQTQRTWDASQNWAKITASDAGSGVAQIGWSAQNNGSGITWVSANASHTFTFTSNAPYYAYARDVAGNLSAALPFTIDRIDKHSPVIDSIAWEKAWTQQKTVTVTAHDTESGLGQYAMTTSKTRPTKWQNSPIFSGITQNGTYYLWAKDNVGRVSGDPDASGGGGKGPDEIIIDTIDRSKPVMDAINHSATDNAPKGAFAHPYFNEVDRPELLAHDLADEGWKDSGINAIYYQFVADGVEPSEDWLVYDDTQHPAMREEFLGTILAYAEDNAGNVSAPMDAAFLFEQTPPTASHRLKPSSWTNGNVEILIEAQDAFSGVRDILLPSGKLIEGDAARFTVERNGVHRFTIRDNCGNTLEYPVEVKNIDLLAPKASYALTPNTWTNQTVTIGFAASDPSPEDGYAASEVKTITLPDGEVVEADTAEFTVEKNGVYVFVVEDHAGNSEKFTVEVKNIDLLAPQASYTLTPDVWTNQTVTIGFAAKDPDPEDGYAASEVKTITLPDGKVVEADTAEFVVEKNGVYTFVVVDHAGNSEKFTVEVKNIDLLTPKASYTLTPDVWTNQTVTIGFAAKDPDPEDGYAPSGVKTITLPDGEVVEADTAEFTVEKNGVYVFVVEDHAGNSKTFAVEVKNIDLTPPEVDYHFETQQGGEVKYPAYGETEFYNQTIALIAAGKDGDSDIERYEYRVGDGAWQTFDPSNPPLLEEEQISTIQVRVQDVAGNVSEVKSRDIVLDKTPPKPSHTLEPEGNTNGKVTIHIGANYDICGPQSLVLPDGRVVYAASNATFTVSQNGRYPFTFWDRCGNRADYTVEVGSITAPATGGGTAKPKAESPPPKPEAEIMPEPTPEAAPITVFGGAAKALPRLTLLDLFFTLLALVCTAAALLRRRKKKEELQADTEHGKEREKGKNFQYDKSNKARKSSEAPKRRVFTRAKLPNLITALATLVLFFLTQPLVWRFRMVDIWTLLFAIFGGVALWLMLWERKKEEKAEEKPNEDTEETV